MSAQTTLNAAIAAGFDKLSTRDVMLCILEGASGGGGGTQNLFVNLGGVAPVTAGTATGQLAIDSSTGKGWVWNGTTWKQIF